MPAPVVVVHDEVETCEALLHALSEAALDAVGFTNPLSALEAVEKDSQLRVLVTRMSFGPGRLNGIALFRMLEHKRIALGVFGSLRPVFIGRPDYRREAEAEGEFLPKPVDPQVLVKVVRKLLKPDGAVPLRMATGPMLWEGAAMALPAPVPVPQFSYLTGRLLRDAQAAIDRAAAIRRWHMPTRRPFDIPARATNI